MNLVERIQFLCNRKNLTISKLEKELGFSRGSIYKWEKSFPSSDKIKALTKYFSVDGDYFLGTDNLNFPHGDISSAIFSEMQAQKLDCEDIYQIASIPEKVMKEMLEESEDISQYVLNVLVEEVFGLNYWDFLEKYGLYDDFVPRIFGGDISAFEAFKKARDKDAEMDFLEHFISPNEIKMIARGGDHLPESVENIIKEAVKDIFCKIYNQNTESSDDNCDI